MNKFIIFLIGLGMVGWGGVRDEVWAADPNRPGRGHHRSISPSEFQRVLLAELNQRFGRPGHDLSLSILFPKKAFPVPSGSRRLEVAPITDGGRTGRRAFRVSVFSGSKFVQTVNVVGNLKARARVVTPNRWMKAHEIIQAKDLSSSIVNLPSLSHDFFLDASAVFGKQVLRPLPPRRPIRKVSVEEPPQVHKGDRVMIEVRQGGLLVQTVGLAKAAGKTGETIPIKNQQSGREVLGRVIAAGHVQVGF